MFVSGRIGILVDGRLRALGTTDELKRECSSGLRVDVTGTRPSSGRLQSTFLTRKIPAHVDDIDSVHDFLVERFADNVGFLTTVVRSQLTPLACTVCACKRFRQHATLLGVQRVGGDTLLAIGNEKERVENHRLCCERNYTGNGVSPHRAGGGVGSGARGRTTRCAGK